MQAAWKFWLFCAVFLPITIGLGFWQLDRAEQKQSRSHLFAEQMQLAPVDLATMSDHAQRAFRPYRLQGVYEDEIFLLDNQLRQGRVGYDVLQVVKLDQGSRILVNRGWHPASPYRDHLPEVATPAGAVHLVGYFYAPDGEVPVWAEEPQVSTWPRRVQQLDWDTIERSLGVSLLRQEQFRLADEEQAGALATGWPIIMGSAAKHYGYAVQWFAMALALCLLTIWATLRLRKEQVEEQIQLEQQANATGEVEK